MKKILHFAGSLILTTSVFAQLPVSTTPTKRVAILEELTGINCQYCPDGHRISNDIQVSNPGKVYAINIHAGGYATPSGSQPDYRTTEGNAIDVAADPNGYPAGGVNRGIASGWASDRGTWSSKANTIISQNSPVNIAVQGTVNESTRQLVVDVEVYYTGTASSDSNFLSIALLQSNVAGPQSDGGNFNPEGWQDQGAGIYNHVHMFRGFINPNKTGEKIMTNTGSVVSKQYTYTLPSDISGVDLDLLNIDLIAFVTEKNNYTSPIVSGAHGGIYKELNNGLDYIDLSAKMNHSKSISYCEKNFTPSVIIKNEIFSNLEIDTFEVSYILNGTAFSEVVYKSLNVDSEYVHKFPAITLIEGKNTIQYSVSTTKDLSSFDSNTDNDATDSDEIFVLKSSSIGSEYLEDFESSSKGDLAPPNSILENPDMMRIEVVNTAGAYDQSKNSYKWSFKNADNGDKASLIWEKLDFTNLTHPTLFFDNAYGIYKSKNDKLKIYFSTDCGVNWIFHYLIDATELSTFTSNGSPYTPDSAEWTSRKIDLSDLAGESEVNIKMEGTSAVGGYLYLDNINIKEDLAYGIQDNLANSFQVYPNPTNGVVNLTFDVQKSENVMIQVYDGLGKLLNSKDLGSKNGSIQHQLDLSGFNSGIYFVNVVVGNNTISKKITLK